MRRALDFTYSLALWLAALCLMIIAALVAAQVAGRIADAFLVMLGQPRTGFVILSLSEIAGYLLAAASFLALSATLKGGIHIRVTMLLSNVAPLARQVIESGALLFGSIASGYATWQIARFAYESWRFNELSPGLIPVPLVYPQAAMAVGALLLTIAFIDEFIICLRTGKPSFAMAEDAVTLGKEG